MGYKRKTRIRPLLQEPEKPKCPCGAAVAFQSADLSKGFCSDNCYLNEKFKDLKIGQVIQYYSDVHLIGGELQQFSLRTGYVAGTMFNGSMWVQPIGPKNAALPDAVLVDGKSLVRLAGEPQFAKEKIMSEVENVAKKSAKKTKKAAGKTAAPKKAASSKRLPNFGEDATVKLLKVPEEGAFRGNILAITDALKDNGKKLTVAELVKKMKSGTNNAKGEAAVWDFHKGKLIAGGYIEVTPAA